MNLPRSTFYYRKKHELNARIREAMDMDVKERIDSVHVEFPTYGYRRLHHELRRRGDHINSKRIRRIQRKYGLFAVMLRRFIATTDSRGNAKHYPCLFEPGMKLTALNQMWVADITYIRILSGYVFAAVILDLFSRRAIGWAISNRINAGLCVAALQHAIQTRDPPPGCVHHSDRGIQYVSDTYMSILEERGFVVSMSRRGNPYDNAAAESFMKTLKYEEVYLNDYETMQDVLERVPRFIEDIYNKKRIHSALGYLTPSEFEAKLQVRSNINPEAFRPPQI